MLITINYHKIPVVKQQYYYLYFSTKLRTTFINLLAIQAYSLTKDEEKKRSYCTQAQRNYQNITLHYH